MYGSGDGIYLGTFGFLLILVPCYLAWRESDWNYIKFLGILIVVVGALRFIQAG